MDKPYSVVALIGLPRSGTTIVYRSISAHSRVDGIIEPYQTRRADDYDEACIDAICEDFEIEAANDRSLLVKETATRLVNIRLTLDLLQNARLEGCLTGLIMSSTVRVDVELDSPNGLPI